MTTWSPICTSWTSSPTATATPAPSCPPTRFCFVSNGQSPKSAKFKATTFPSVEIGMTDSAVLDVDENLIVSNFGNRNLFEFEWCIVRREYNGRLFFVHGFSYSVT